MPESKFTKMVLGDSQFVDNPQTTADHVINAGALDQCAMDCFGGQYQAPDASLER